MNLNRPYSFTVHTEHGDEVEIDLERQCPQCGGAEISRYTGESCPRCGGSGFKKTYAGDVILEFIAAYRGKESA